MPNMVEEKLEYLKGILRSLESVIISYSGGVDSTFLSKVAFDVLRDNALAVTARSETYPPLEFQEAVYVTMDLQGYRSGSMNEVLSQ